MLADEGLELLTEEQCRHLLGSQTLGRVGVSVGALPAIFPVNYTVADGDILFRTGPGQKLRAALDRTVVAFEVDQADESARRGWSVLVIGKAEEVSDDAAASSPDGPRSWVGGDRSHLVRIRPEMITGRRIVG